MPSPSLDSQPTPSSLIVGVQAHDERAWHRLVDLYGPLVYYWCRRAGLSPEDVADTAQEVFRSVATRIGAFHKTGAGDTFRGWLHTITQNKIRDHFRRRGLEVEAAGGTEALQFLQQVPGDGPSLSGSGDPPAVRELLQRALDQIRGDFNEQTWEAFCEGVFKGRNAADIAAELGISHNAVRKAKARVLQRLREQLGGWEQS